MKAMFTGLLKGRITRWSLLLAGAALIVVLGTAASDQGQSQIKLGGTWIGSSPGAVFNAVHAPLDPARRTAAIRVKHVSYDAAAAGLVAAFGADTWTEMVGQIEMTGRTSAQGKMIGYFTQGNNPPLICAILVYHGPTEFPTPDTEVVGGVVDVYLAAADADADGFPDPGTTPVVTIPLNATALRVTVP